MGTHHVGKAAEVRALNAYIKLMRASESVSSRLSRRVTSYGLTMSQFGAMEALYHIGPLHQHELGEKILRSSGNITLIVDNLERHGYAERRRDTDDRRFITVHLTPKGRRLIRDIFPSHVSAIEEEMGALTAEEQEDLGRLCRKLGLREGTARSDRPLNSVRQTQEASQT
jgi:MarR family 2-MHQ and catechol resistance regulon transcriptional repressor